MFENYLEKLVDAIKEHLNKNLYVNKDSDYNFIYKKPIQHHIDEHHQTALKPF